MNESNPRGEEAKIPADVEAEVARQKVEILRGSVDVISEQELDRKLARSITTGVPLRVKLGVDPTASDLHLGFTVPLNKLRVFQDLGHLAVLIIGDATAMVGDPTGRNKTRPPLTHDDVSQNATTYLDQAAKVIDVDAAEIVRNGAWLHSMDFQATIKLLSRYTVARMLERDDFSKRYKSQTPIYIHEFMYPLMQGWDSVAVKSDIELGGTDQLFNLLVGRDLQQQEGQEPQVCLTGPLVLGLDGEKKMSKSYNNYIGVTESPDDMFTKTMRINDTQMRDWFTLLTRVPVGDIDALLAEGANPRDVKIKLGETLVSMYHDTAAGSAASERWLSVVSNKELPSDLREISLPAALKEEAGYAIVALVEYAFPEAFKSRGEIRRLCKGGGITLDGDKVTDPQAFVAPLEPAVLKAGKKNVCRVLP